jgi:diaminohydroxyphosphoribosylaminopyrimidine deaminase/5-amino-6-(5-phosphoribosylamino)uracil reductase
MVGCVIVKDGKVIGEGRHAKFGGPHAEPNAMAGAEESLKDATLYCNLEPCSHTNKKTPPCAPRIIESGIKRVVISSIDPNPEVKGNGVKLMRESGIEVETGVLEDTGNYLNRFFFKHMSTGLPYVTLKIAQSSDGYITAKEGTQTWITGKESAEYVHSLRASYDAVLVGAGTVNIDNPKLNVRHVEGRNPVRVVIDGMLNSNQDADVFNDEDRNRTMLFCSNQLTNNQVSIFRDKGVKVQQLKTDADGRININDVLSILGKENIISVLVEGGADIFTRFVENNLFDEVIMLTSPLVLGGGIPALKCEFPPILRLFEESQLGNDLKKVFIRSLL